MWHRTRQSGDAVAAAIAANHAAHDDQAPVVETPALNPLSVLLRPTPVVCVRRLPLLQGHERRTEPGRCFQRAKVRRPIASRRAISTFVSRSWAHHAATRPHSPGVSEGQAPAWKGMRCSPGQWSIEERKMMVVRRVRSCRRTCPAAAIAVSGSIPADVGPHQGHPAPLAAVVVHAYHWMQCLERSRRHSDRTGLSTTTRGMAHALPCHRFLSHAFELSCQPLHVCATRRMA